MRKVRKIKKMIDIKEVDREREVNKAVYTAASVANVGQGH